MTKIPRAETGAIAIAKLNPDGHVLAQALRAHHLAATSKQEAKRLATTEILALEMDVTSIAKSRMAGTVTST